MTNALLVLGTLYTMDPAQPRAEAALIRRGRFACVGTRAECESLAGSGARRFELGKGSAVPGLADAHGHVLSFARSLEEVSCVGFRDQADCVRRAAERAASLPPGAWLRGRGWDQNLWPDQAFPTEQPLSAAIPDRPAVLVRIDGHAAWVNARALAAAGIGRETPDPPGGRIHRLSDGRPSGLLVDTAMDAVLARIPEPSDAERERLLLVGLRSLARLGLTAVHDAGVDDATLEVYFRLAQAGRLPLHVNAMLDGTGPDEALRGRLERWAARRVTGRLTVQSVKLFADGALGSRGAALIEPYADEPQSRGLLLLEPEALRARLALVARAGFQPAVHAIGDRACREVLRAFAELPALRERGLRPRVEHLQILRADDVALLARSGAVASMQPVHAVSDGPWAEARLGHGTPAQRGAYAWRQVAQAGGVLAFGSDFPVESPDPRLGLLAAELRVPSGASEPWMPEQRLARAEALRAFTWGAAYAEGAEDRRGMVRVGYEADLTAFAGDLLAAAAAQIPAMALLATIVDGEVVWEAP